MMTETLVTIITLTRKTQTVTDSEITQVIMVGVRMKIMSTEIKGAQIMTGMGTTIRGLETILIIITVRM